MRRLAAFLLAFLLASPAGAQQPLTGNVLGQVQMPPSSVLGNSLPVPSGLNAIPFAVLTPGLLQGITGDLTCTVSPPVCRLANANALSLKGNNTSSPAPPIDLNGLQAEGLLQFLQSGSGSVQRSLDGRLKEVVSLKDFGASGSIQATTGTILASSSSLTLASAIDFVNGQGIRINRAGPTFATNPPTGLTVAQQGATGATTYQYQVASMDAGGGVGVPVAAVSIANGNATVTCVNNVLVSWTAPGSGPAPAAYAVYGRTSGSNVLLAIVSQGTTWQDCGASGLTPPDWMTAAPLGAATNDYLLTTIVSGAGTTSMTLAANAVNAASNQVATHDDTQAINNAIASLPTTGGLVQIPPGNYPITSVINIGNGSGATASTSWGQRLECTAARVGVNGFAGTPSIGPCNIHSGSLVGAIAINGPLNSWALKNLSIDFSITTTQGIGLVLASGSWGNVDGLFVNSPHTYGIDEVVTATNKNGQQNTFNDIAIFLDSNAAAAQGMHLSGTAAIASGPFEEHFRHVQIIPNRTDQIGVYLGLIDTVTFYDLWMNPTGAGSATSVFFDYGINNMFPSGIKFYGFEHWGNLFGINGTPANQNLWNQVWGFSRINGAIPPNMPNLQIMDFMMGNGTPAISAGTCVGAGDGVVGSNWHGTVTGSTANSTTCTITFANPAFTSTPDCVVSGLNTAITGYAIGATQLAVSYASSPTMKWVYSCQGP